jgi:hypothetical protein
MLVCIGPALAQLPALGPGGPRPGGPAPGARAPQDDGGLPKENQDDRADMIARLGPNAALMMRPPLPADAPLPSPDPRNFEGTWYHEDPLVMYMAKDMFGLPLPFTPEGLKVVQRRSDGIKNGKPYINASAYCIPTGPFWQFDLNMPFNIVQNKDMMELHFEEFHESSRLFRCAKARPLVMGRSIAH